MSYSAALAGHYAHSLSEITERTERTESSLSQFPSNPSERPSTDDAYTRGPGTTQPLTTETIPRRLTQVKLPEVSGPLTPSLRAYEKKEDSRARKGTKKRQASIVGAQSLSEDQIVDLIESCFEGNEMIDLDFPVKKQTIVCLYEDMLGRNFRFHIPRATECLTEVSSSSSRSYVIEIFPQPYGQGQHKAWRTALSWTMPEARRVLGSKCPKLATTGTLYDHRLVGTVSYEVYVLPKTEKEGELRLLSQIWGEMGSRDRKAMVKQILGVRQKLAESTLNEQGYRALNSHEKLPPPSSEKWEIQHLTELGRQRRREHVALECFTEAAWALNLLERFSDGLHPLLVLLSRGTFWVQTASEDVKQAPLLSEHLAELRQHLRLTHLGLTPENILISTTPRRFRSPIYEVKYILGWGENLVYSPPSFDLAALDTKFGRSLAMPDYYHLFRGQVGPSDIPENLSPAAAMNLNVLVHLINKAKRKENAPPRVKMLQAKQTEWLKKEMYVYDQRQGWVKDVLSRRFKPKNGS